jgi:Na+/H+ antiporter NhaD/arsenite permease-like protein
VRERVKRFVRVNIVTLIALLAAAVSFLFSPAVTWWKAIDWATLNLLFCLMVVVAGMRECALFRTLAAHLLKGRRHYRALAHALVQLTFWLAMLVTNDVALIALTPFAIFLLDQLHLRDRIPGLIVLQTIAANLGSMATPVGNPQNLFLYTAYALSPMDFFAAMLPITLAGALLLVVTTHFVKDAALEEITTPDLPPMPRKIWAYGALFALCLCSVFRVVPGWITFVVVTIGALCCGGKALKRVDYALLVTFICFFVFSGNLAQIEAIRTFFAGFLTHHAQATAAIVSQLLSNVPAAILLEPFTENWKALLLGADIGGFGTLIASLASLISFGIYLKEADAKPLRYLWHFTVLNVLFFVFLSFCSRFC